MTNQIPSERLVLCVGCYETFDKDNAPICERDEESLCQGADCPSCGVEIDESNYYTEGNGDWCRQCYADDEAEERYANSLRY